MWDLRLKAGHSTVLTLVEGYTTALGRVFTNPSEFVQFFDQVTRDRLTLTPAGEIGNTGRNFFELAPSFNLECFRLQAYLPR